MKNIYRKLILVPLLLASFLFIPYLYSGETILSQYAYAYEIEPYLKSIASGMCGDNVKWEVFVDTRDDGGVDNTVVISGFGDMYDYSDTEPMAPWYYVDLSTSNLNYYTNTVIVEDGVTSIGDYAFCDLEYLKSVSLPDSVTRIGEGAFYGSKSLSEISIPSGVSRIEQYAFRSSSLKILNLSEGLNYIGRSAFENCKKLTNPVFPESLKRIAYDAFCGCTGLTEVIIPDGTECIEHTAFSGCSGITKVVIPESVSETAASEYITGSPFVGCTKLHSAGPIGGDYDIQFGWTEAIPDYMFCGMENLDTIIIPDGIKTIGKKSFECGSYSEDFNIKKIVIPASVESVGEEAFGGCWADTAGPIGSDCSVEFGWTDVYPVNAFAKMGIRKLIMPDGLETIESNTLDCSTVQEIILPGTLKIIGENAFRYYQQLTSLEIPYGVTTIRDNAFCECDSLRDITIPGSVTNMGRNVFSLCKKLRSAGPIGGDYNIKIGWTERIPDNAFYGTVDVYSQQYGLKSVVLPQGLKTIGIDAFRDCKRLTEVIIPEGVTELGGGAFTDCISLVSVTIPGSVDTIRRDSDCVGVFDGCVNLVTAGPAGGNYNIQYGWTEKIPDSAFASRRFYEEECGVALKRVVFPKGIKAIGNVAFANCRNLTAAVIPDGTESIGEGVFSGCKSLSLLVIPSSATEVGIRIVAGCPELRTAGPLDSGCDIRFGWKEIIPDGVFRDCSGLEEVTIPKGVYMICADAFSNCSKLEKVRIPDTVTYIGAYKTNYYNYYRDPVFDGCPKLETAGFTGSGCDIEFGWSSEIPRSAFLGSSIKKITIPEGVTQIGDEAFRDCKTLVKVLIPSTATNIGEGIFYGCTQLESAGPIESTCNIRFAWSSKIPAYAFDNCTNLSIIEIPERITAIDYAAFRNCSSLTVVEIPYRVKTISSCAFEGCTSMYEITLPESLTNIYGGAFLDCSALRDVYFCGTEEEWNTVDVDNGNDSNAPLLNATFHFIKRVTVSGVLKQGDDWKITWSCSYIEKRDGVKENAELRILGIGMQGSDWEYINSEIGDGSTMPWLSEEYGISKDDILHIYISGYLYTIPNQFAGYSNLKSVELKNVYGLAQGSFCNCPKLGGVYVYGTELTTIDQAAFKNDTNLDWFEFMDEDTKLLNIGSEAFAETALSSLELPESTEKIGSGAFSNTPLRTIILNREVNSIGDNAFEGCKPTIKCFKDTYAHNYAIDNDFPFILMDVPVYPVLKHGDDNVVYECKNTFEGTLFETSSGEYNSSLSYMLAVLSRAVYSESQIAEDYASLGFEDTKSDFNDDLTVGYVIGRKKVDDTTIILVTIRGSFGWSWASNFDISCLASGIHIGFNNDANSINAVLNRYSKYSDTNRTVYVITGHSQGAAAGNLLAKNLIDSGISGSDVYDYNFAYPNVARCSPFDDNLSYWSKDGKYNSIFNISNSSDPVPCLPSQIVLKWGKYGRSYWFDSKDHEAMGHDMKFYINNLGEMLEIEDFKSSGDLGFVQLFGIHCPVDVTVYNSEGKPVAGVANNIPQYYDSKFGEVFIFTEGDEKYFFLPAGEKYTVSMTATDNGKMRFEAGLINHTAQTMEQKEFDSVQLTKDKEMICETGGDTAVEDTKLYVVDDDFNKIGEIEVDGSEHPISSEDCDHVWKSDFTIDKDSTCIEEGIKSIHCSICGAKMEGSEQPVPVKSHEYGEWTVTKEATAYDEGIKSRTCTMCGDVQTETIPKKTDGDDPSDPEHTHTYGEWTATKPATEIAAGIQTRICSVCGNTETETIAMLTPTLKAVKIVKPKVAKKSATIKWKKLSSKNLKKIKTIQIQYSTDKSFKKDVKEKYSKATKTSYKIKGLKKGKKYFVHIRAYTKSGDKVHVSKWSATKSFKAK